MSIPCVTHGAELPMTEIVKMAIDSLGIHSYCATALLR